MKHSRTLAEKWLWLGVFALGLAGLYSLVPVVARTPQLKSLGLTQALFDVALVVHVDLSVLIWFCAMLGMGGALVLERVAAGFLHTLARGGFYAVATATVLMALSPLGDGWEVVKSNYIPVLQNGLFFLSLGLLMAGLVAALLPVVVAILPPPEGEGWGGGILGTDFAPNAPLLTSPLRGEESSIHLGWVTASFVFLLALVGYVLGALTLPADLPPAEHYEQLFWGGGHVMQFAFTLIVMVAWLMLLVASGRELPARRLTMAAYGLTLLGAVLSLGGYAFYPADSGDFTHYQTRMMIEIGGVGATLLGAAVILRVLRRKRPLSDGAQNTRTYTSCLVMSLILFFAGGALGLLIAGQNVIIPAHYHGMIVGITLALMGVAYAMLPRFGYASVAQTRLAFYQPIVYGVGQLMHIGGLAYCGGYGILRKTAGGFEGIALDIKIALGIFGLGGLLAIIGGVLFVVVMLRARPSVSLHAAGV